MPIAEFTGLGPWLDDFPRVEFETQSGIVDLHNNAKFTLMHFCPSESVLTLKFKYASHWRRIETHGILAMLTFVGVGNLKILQASNFDPRAAESLEGLVHRVESDTSHFQIDLGDVTCELTATRLVLSFVGQ